MLNAEALMQLLPHRYPFLLVDAVAEFEPDVHVVAVKNVTHNEPFFLGHLPGTPVMPGMLVVEALAQAGGVLLMAGTADATAKVVYFASLDNVRWHGAVHPGDQLRLHVRVTHARGRMRKVRAEARVGGEVVCEAEMAAVVMDR